MASERIPVYFSHSYRHEDRDINHFFWRLLWANGFTLTVDPESESLSIPYLEYMMKRSAAFVAIVTRRPEQQTYQCSPFMVFEYGLAIQAQKPRLVLVESGVSKHFFPESAQVVYFSRQALDTIKAEVENRLRLLAKRSDAAASTLGHGLGRVGILVGAKKDARQGLVHALIQQLGYTPVELDTEITDAFRLSLRLDELDFIVLDLHSPRLPPWLLPFINGRFIPTVKLLNKTAEGGRPSSAPSYETSDLLETVAKPEELFVYYGTLAELKRELSRHVERLREERIIFTSLLEGTRYFRSLGRRRDMVFISNAGDANECGRALSVALNRENVPHFHYRYGNNIELAEQWAEELPRRIRNSQYFLPLITEQYWRSKFCFAEYELARERAATRQIKIIPYFLGSSLTDIPEQGRDVSELPARGQARQIAADLDRMLIAAERKRDQSEGI